MRLGLFHELGEVYAGDVIPRDNMTPGTKFNTESEGANKVFSNLPNPEKYTSIWLEYATENSSEAIFIKQVDKLEMALQANLYEKMSYTNLDEFFSFVEERIKSLELKSILEEIIKLR